MTNKTPEQRSEERWPSSFIPGTSDVRTGYSICIREKVEPLEEELEQKTAENVRLRDAGNAMCVLLCLFYKEAATTLPAELRADLVAKINAWGEAAKQEGFVPTNTTEG